MDDLDKLAHAAGQTARTRQQRRTGKVHQLIGGVVIVLGVILAVGAFGLKIMAERNPDIDPDLWKAVAIGSVAVIVIGWVWYFVGRLGEWWHDY